VTIVLTTWAILPFVALFPTWVGFGSRGEPHDITVVVVGVLVAIVIAMASIASQMRDAARVRLLRNVAVFTAISTVASFLLGFLLRLDIPFGIPIPHILGPALGTDGESAYDAGVFEAYCELWLCVAGIVGTVIFVGRWMSRRTTEVES
jgi:hypothetical protein